jgi:hypothetical protein
MSRPLMPLLRCLFCVLLLGLPATGRAQPALPEENIEPECYDVKERAKEAFEASQATTRDLARSRRDAAQTQLRVRLEKYLAGAQDATLDLLLEVAAFLAEAELAALENPTPEERLAPLAAYWLYALTAEEQVEGKYRNGRVSLADFMKTRHDLLHAEIKLRQAGQKSSEPFLIASLPFDGENALVDFDVKAAAKRAFETGQADLRDLARRRREAARIQFQVRYGKYRAGAQDATLDLLLQSAAFLVKAELSALEKPTPDDRLASRAADWRFAQEADNIVEAKYKVGRVSLADFMQARHARLDAEIQLRRANGGQKLPAPVPTTAVALDGEEDFDGLDSKALAKAQFEAGQADLRDLARARRAAIHSSLQERYEKYRAGAQDATLDLLLEAARQMLDAELADHDDPAERLEAVQRYWELSREAEKIVEAKYRVRRVSLADYAQAQGQRLDAEIRMQEARAKVKEK